MIHFRRKHIQRDEDLEETDNGKTEGLRDGTLQAVDL